MHLAGTKSQMWAAVAVAAMALSFLAPFAIAQGNPLVWGTVPSPNRNDKSNTLKGIAAVSDTDIWAVGEFNPGVPPTETGRRTLAEHWDGTAWRIVPTPNPSWTGLDLATLEAADKVATNDVWAVGFSEDFGSLAIRTLTEHWDGTRWIIVPSPNPAGPKLPNQLFDVAAVAANDAWSVGAVTTDYRPLILHWDGSIWRAVANNCGGKYNELHGITALSVADIWAVGEFTTCHYDGKSWTAFAIPPSGGTDTLFDVSAVSANDVWAVGQSIFCDAYHCYAEPYAIHWNGSQWQKTLAPGVILSGVAAQSTDDVFAVGTYNVGTLIIHWDGSQWTEVPSPDPGVGGFLNEITATGPDQLWAVGSFYNSGFKERTLALQAPSKTQGTLVGDTQISGAQVSWFGPQKGATTTDVYGHYNAAGLPAGTYAVFVSAQGCTPEGKRVTVTAGEIKTQDFQLQCP